MKSYKNGSFRLEKGDCMIVIGEEKIELVLPKFKDEDEVPPHALAAAAISLMLGKEDKDLEALISDKLEAYLLQEMRWEVQ